MTRRALLVVAKRPAAGQTKTRLTPALSGEQAAALYECFLKDTLEIIRTARGALELTPVIAYLPKGEEAWFRDLAPDFELLLQQGDNLSERLHHATTHYLALGCEQVAIMDSDSPTLPAHCLVEAFTALDDPAVDVSFGTVDDGGYYLIGLKRPCADLFLKVPMSTPTVAQDTLAQAALNRLTVHRLPNGYDIDTVEELRRLIAELENLPESIAPHTRTFLAENPGWVRHL
jgi:rSAM/selenodomain-associated transferase 1